MSRFKLPSFGSIYYAAICVVLYLPILLLIIFSFNNATALVFPLKGFTLKWYGQLFENRELLNAVGNSLMIGVGSSLVATILGTMGAIAIVRFALNPSLRDASCCSVDVMNGGDGLRTTSLRRTSSTTYAHFSRIALSLSASAPV